MKLTIATLCFCMLAGNALAEDKADRQLVLDYFKVARMEQTMNTSVDAMVASMLPNAGEQDKRALKDMVNATVGWEAAREQLIAIASEIYTRQELKAAIAYMKTKPGASMIAKNETFAKLYAEQMAANLQKLLESSPAPSAAPIGGGKPE